MNKLLVMFSLLFCQTALFGDSLVFMSPIKAGKVEEIKNSGVLYSKDEVHFFKNIGIDKYQRWIQTSQKEKFFIHHLEGHDIKSSLLKFQERIDLNDPIAIALKTLYKETLGFDMTQEESLPKLKPVTDLLAVDVLHADQSFTKEYCFVYPILPGKEHKLLEMYADKSEYFSDEVKDILRFRGISKMQLWIEEVDERSFIVVYQEIVGSVNESREKYLEDKSKEFSKKRSAQYSEITGLAYEELLPTLESLFDHERLE